MTVDDIVKVTQYLTSAEDIADYAKVKYKFLGDARPVFMLLVVPQYVWLEILVEVEVIPGKGSGDGIMRRSAKGLSRPLRQATSSIRKEDRRQRPGKSSQRGKIGLAVEWPRSFQSSGRF